MYIKKLFDYSVPLVAAATVFVVGLIVVAVYAGYVVREIKLGNDTIVVTGSAKEQVSSDTGRWTINLEARTSLSEQQAGFTRLDDAVGRITAYLDEQGFTEYETPAGTSYPVFTYPQYSEPMMVGYAVSRSIIVRSGDIDGLAALTNNIAPLSGQGYNVSTGGLELTVSTLPEIRVRLLTDAIKDATDRAKAIAQDSGRAVGTLRNASSGVVQVLPQGGVEISDYGSYDTMSKEKEVMVTVRATFSLK